MDRKSVAHPDRLCPQATGICLGTGAVLADHPVAAGARKRRNRKLLIATQAGFSQAAD